MPLTTPRLGSTKGGHIFAVGLNGSIRVGVDAVRGEHPGIKHETLFGNEPVMAAGEIFFRKGVVENFNDFSGTYDTSNECRNNRFYRRSLREALIRVGIDISRRARAKLAD